jgi:hypothetical protein
VSIEHLSICKHGWGGVNERHNKIVDEVSDILATIGIRHRVEHRDIGPNHNSGPDIIATILDREVALDVTCAQVDQQTGLRHAAEIDRYHAAAAEQRKTERYAAELRASGRDLLTLAIESTGAIGNQFHTFWQRVYTHAFTRDLEPTFPRTWATPTFTSYAQQRIAITHAKSSIRIIRRRVEAWLAEHAQRPRS